MKLPAHFRDIHRHIYEIFTQQWRCVFQQIGKSKRQEKRRGGGISSVGVQVGQVGSSVKVAFQHQRLLQRNDCLGRVALVLLLISEFSR